MTKKRSLKVVLIIFSIFLFVLLFSGLSGRTEIQAEAYTGKMSDIDRAQKSGSHQGGTNNYPWTTQYRGSAANQTDANYETCTVVSNATDIDDTFYGSIGCDNPFFLGYTAVYVTYRWKYLGPGATETKEVTRTVCDGSGYSFLDGTTSSKGSIGDFLTKNREGVYSIEITSAQIRIRDFYTSTASYANQRHLFYVKRTAPSISFGAHGTVKNTIQTATASSNIGIYSMEKRLNSGSWASVTGSSISNDSTDGTWYFRGKDWLGAYSVERNFIFDKTAPTVTSPTEFNNSNVAISFSDANGIGSAKYSRNPLSSSYPSSVGINFTSGTSFSDEGRYRVEVVDSAGNKTTRKFCIDKTAPTVTNPAEFNKVNVAITFSDHSGIGSAKYSRNALSSGYPTSAGTNFTSGTSFSDEGRYRVEVVDSAGNKTTKLFCIDKTDPDLQIYGKKSGGSFVLGASADYFVEAYIKSVDHNYSTQNSVEFKQVGSDTWENYTYYLETVYYDNTKEGLAVVYYTTKQAAADAIIPGLKATIQAKTNWALADYQALIDGGTHAYGAGQQGLASEGADFWLYQSRKSNNKILIYFNLSDLNNYIEDINNGDVSAYIATETNQVLKVEGEYSLTVYDKAGNFTTKTLFIDSTKPTVQCTVEHEGYTNTVCTIFNNDIYPYKVEYKKPGVNWAEVVADRMDMTADNGLWQFRVVDRAGNTSDIYKITFDDIKPVLNSNIALNSFVKTQEKVSTSDINHLSFSYKEPGKNWVTISNTFYTGNMTNGLWQFKAEDKAGNVSDIYQYTFDNIDPVVTGVLNNVFYNANKVVSFSDVNLDYAKYTRNDHSAGNPTTSTTSFTTGASFSDEGRYRIEVADKAGNKVVLIFVIDKTTPNITGIENNCFYNTNKNIEFSDDTLDSAKYSMNENSGSYPTSANTNFSSGASFSAEGKYFVEVKDKAGNKAVLVFCIDKTAPTLSGAENNNFYNTNKNISFSDYNFSYAKYSKNNNSAGNPASSEITFETGASFSDEGRYRIEVADRAGNKAVLVFCIDKTAPTLSGAENNTFYNTNKNISFSDYNFSYAKYSRNNNSAGNPTASATSFTTGTSFSEEGRYRIEVADKAGNQSVLVFCIDKTAPSITGISDNAFYNVDKIIDFSDYNFSYAKYSRNNNSAGNPTASATSFTTGTSFSDEGRYRIEVADKAGNKTTRIFCIDKTMPVLSSSVATGAFVNTIKTVSLTDFNHDKLKHLEPGASTWNETTSTSIEMTAINGLWKFVATDKAGNSSEVFEITFDNINPIIGLRKENSVTLVDGGFTNAGVYFEPEDVNFEEIVLYKNVSDEWQLIDHTYTVGTNYYDSRETENIKLFKQRADALQYVVSFENQRVKVKSNWDITVPGIIPENQQDLAIEGMSYYEYTLTTGEVYLFFEISGLNNFVTQKSNSYIATNSHEVFFDEGFFKVEAFDKAGNMSFKTFTIDTKIPLGAFVELANNAITNKAVVSFRFEKEGVVVKDYVNDSMHVLTAVFEASGQKYRIDLTEEGYHTLVLEDRAGNMSSYQVYIDRTDAVASHLNVVLQDLEYTNKNTYVINIVDDVELFEVKVNGTTKYKSTEDNKKRSFSTSISTELEHSIEITDRAGNIKTYTVVVDRTKPTIVFTGTLTKENTNVYSNTTINTASSDDRAGVLQTSIKNLQTNAITQMQASQSLNVPDGRYLITVKDKAGNIQEYNYIKYTNNDFKNIETIRKQYIIVSYYKVTLPAYIFNRPNMENIAGVYNFNDQTAVTEFARTKEFEYRVQKVETNEWLYVSASNESVSQKYTNLQDMQAVVNMYARRYVSDRIISKEYAGGISGTIVNEPEFIVNTAAVPEFLPGYADFEIYELKHSFVFSLRNTVYGVKGQARLTYLANDHQIKPEVTIEHLPEETIIQSLTRAEHLKQGYYLVEEYDKCKNSFKYLAYIDLEKPTLTTEVTRGDNTKEEIEITQAYVTENLNVMRYLGFRPQSFLDNIDTDFVVCRIEGRNIEKSFIKGDVLPNLTFNNGYKGKYLITLYDRSYNILKFEIIIAGESPSWSTSSLSEKTENVRIAFSINDSLNAFQEINIYKIGGSGAKVKLTEDSENVLIGAANLYYTFVTGGKYQAEMIDLYGRTTWTRPIFYLKGLPKGILSTADGGLTNRDVVFVFDTKYEAIAYITAGEEKEITTDYLVAIDEVSKTKTLTFIAKEGLDRVPFLIYLYDKADNNTYVEYTFGIDTVMSPIRMEKKNTKEEIVKGGSSNEGVVISYEDSDLVIRYTLNNNNRVYRRGDVLEEDGLYSFELRDIAGNREEFSLYIDTKVRYKIKGNYITLDSGKLLSNESITIEVLEAVSKYQVKNKNLRQDEPFVEDGIYEVHIEDLYGNNVDIVIEIDKVAPVASLVGGTNGRKTKEKVGVQFEEGAEAFLYKSFTLIKQLENNEYIDAEGEYRIVVQDQAGNKTTLTFEIDRTVEASLNIPNMSITTNRVSIISKEDIQMKVLKNGSEIEKATFFTEPGEYKVVLTDSVNNTKEMHFLIIDKGFSYLDLPKFKDSKILEVQKDGYIVEHEGFQFNETGKYELKLATNTEEAYTLSFIIDSEKPVLDVVSDKKHVISFRNPNKTDLKGVLYKDGQIIDENFLLSTQLKEPGAYKLVLIDSYGNENSYDFEIKKHINTAGIVGISIACALVLGLLMYGLISKLKIKAH